MSKEPDDAYTPTDGSRPRRRPYEIESDGGPPVLDASRPSGELPEIMSEIPVQKYSPSQNKEIAHLQRHLDLLWKAIHDLEQRVGVGKDG